MTLDAILLEIKAAMERKGLTARMVAEAIGTSEQSVGRWLNGKHAPSVENLEALAMAVGLEVALRKLKAAAAVTEESR